MLAQRLHNRPAITHAQSRPAVQEDDKVEAASQLAVEELHAVRAGEVSFPDGDPYGRLLRSLGFGLGFFRPRANRLREKTCQER